MLIKKNHNLNVYMYVFLYACAHGNVNTTNRVRISDEQEPTTCQTAVVATATIWEVRLEIRFHIASQILIIKHIQSVE